jgi:lipopolysaccharide transport system permease protein
MFRNVLELYQYRALLWSLTLRELKARYRASVLGFLWTFLNPTLQMAVYTWVFTYVVQQRIEAYSYFLFVGLLPWICFSSTIVGGTTAVSERRDLLTKVRFPAQVLPATVVLTHLLNYVLSLPLMFLLGALYGIVPSWHGILFLPLLLLQAFFSLALTYLLSAFNVAFRDLQHIVQNIVMLGFFLTPVLWEMDGKPEWVQTWVPLANPVSNLILAYRDIFYFHRLPPLMPQLYVLGVSLVVFGLASMVFDRRREEFAEQI